MIRISDVHHQISRATGRSLRRAVVLHYVCVIMNRWANFFEKHPNIGGIMPSTWFLEDDSMHKPTTTCLRSPTCSSQTDGTFIVIWWTELFRWWPGITYIVLNPTLSTGKMSVRVIPNLGQVIKFVTRCECSGPKCLTCSNDQIMPYRDVSSVHELERKCGIRSGVGLKVELYIGVLSTTLQNHVYTYTWPLLVLTSGKSLYHVINHVISIFDD